MPESSLNVEITGNEARFQAALNRSNAEVQKLKDKLRDMGSAGDKARQQLEGMGKAGIASAGPAMQNMVAGLAARWLSVGAAVAGVKRALDAIQKQDEEAGRKMMTAEASRAQLAQLAAGDSGKLQQLLKDAEDIYKGGGAADLSQANQIVFALESAGMRQYKELFTLLYPKFGRPEVMAKAGAALQTSLGIAETGLMPAILSKAVEASKVAPASAEEILEASATTVSAAKAHKWTDEETLAAVAWTSKALGSANEAATSLSALGQELKKKPEFLGLGIGEMVKKLTTMTVEESGILTPVVLKSERERMISEGYSRQQIDEEIKALRGSTLYDVPHLFQEYLGGRKEAGTIVAVLKDMLPQLAQTTADIGRAEREGLIYKTIGAADESPKLKIPKVRRKAKAERDLAEEIDGAYNEIVETAQDQLFTGIKEAGNMPRWKQIAYEQFFDLIQLVVGNKTLVQQYGSEEAHALIARLEDAAKKQQEAADNLNAATKTYANQVKDPRQGGCPEVDK
jgi:hypothetical protein